MATQILAALRGHDVEGDLIRVVDHDVRPGVEADMGDGDEWPGIREQVLAADILVLATPTWMGHASSVAHRVLERLDAELSTGNLIGKVAVVGVVGNEDGAHAVSAACFQALNDVGFSLPAQAVAYWNGEAMGSVDYQDLDGTPDKTRETIDAVAGNAAHLARLLESRPYAS